MKRWWQPDMDCVDWIVALNFIGAMGYTFWGMWKDLAR